jgi:hypothetical protein
MSTYLPAQLLALWTKSKLTLEMAVGHILQRLVNHEERLRRLEQRAGLPPQEA